MVIQKIRTYLLKYHIGSLMAISFLFFSCSKDSVIGNQSSNSNAISIMSSTAYTANQIFKGIFFADGPVADLIPELSEFKISYFISDPEQIQGISDLHDEVLVLFETNNPGYLETFKTVMLSGNHVQIESSLLEAAGLLNSTLNEFYNAGNNENDNSTDYSAAQQEFKDALQNSTINQQDSRELATFTKNYLDAKSYASTPKTCAVKVVAVVAAAAVALAVVVWSVAAVIEGYWIFTSKHSFTNGTTLLKDKLINSIAVNL